MTYLEKLANDCPKLTAIALVRIMRYMCPHDFYRCKTLKCSKRIQQADRGRTCYECWRKEMPESNKEDI